MTIKKLHIQIFVAGLLVGMAGLYGASLIRGPSDYNNCVLAYASKGKTTNAVTVSMRVCEEMFPVEQTDVISSVLGDWGPDITDVTGDPRFKELTYRQKEKIGEKLWYRYMRNRYTKHELSGRQESIEKGRFIAKISGRFVFHSSTAVPMSDNETEAFLDKYDPNKNPSDKAFVFDDEIKSKKKAKNRFGGVLVDEP